MSTLKYILWTHHHLDTKTRQRYHQKRTLQLNIFDVNRCKNSQQNKSKPNPPAHREKFIHLTKSDSFQIHKDSSTYKNKSLWYFCYCCLVTKLCPTFLWSLDYSPPGSTKQIYPHIINAIHSKPTANITFMVKSWKSSCQNLEEDKDIHSNCHMQMTWYYI